VPKKNEKAKPVERPFGDPKLAYKRVTIKPKSKCYGLRNIPYRELFLKMNDYKNK